MPRQQAACLAGFVAATLLLAGCGDSNMAVVKGTVTFDGQPLEKGSINFVPVDGKFGTAGGEIKDGQYSASVPVGLMKVHVTGKLKLVGTKKAYDTPNSPEKSIFKEMIPEKQSNPQKTELRFEVKPGMNEKNWDLKSE